MSDIFKNASFWSTIFTQAKDGRSMTCSGKPMQWPQKYFYKGDHFIEIEYYDTSNQTKVRFRSPRQWIIEFRVNKSFLYNPKTADILSHDAQFFHKKSQERFEDEIMHMVLTYQ